jgi:hypothetical protein
MRTSTCRSMIKSQHRPTINADSRMRHPADTSSDTEGPSRMGDVLRYHA